MATRGVFGIIQNNDFKGFFKTGAFLPYFLKDTREMVEEMPDDFDLASIALIDAGHGERATKDYVLSCLVDIDTDKYLLDKADSSENWLNPISISHRDSGINPLNTCGYNLPDASFRPLDALFIELVVIVNLDSKTIDIYKGGLFKFYPELKHCASGEDFINLAASFGQRDNIFVDMYAKHYIDFKKSHEKLRSMSSEDKRMQDFSSRKVQKFLTSAQLFQFGPVMKVASIKTSLLDEAPDDDFEIVKSHVCFNTLGQALEKYIQKKVELKNNENMEFNEKQSRLLNSLEKLMKEKGSIMLYI